MGHFVDSIFAVYRNDYTYAYPAMEVDMKMSDFMQLLNWLKEKFTDELTIKAVYCGKAMATFREPPEAAAFQLRMVAFKVKETEGEYFWIVSPFLASYDFLAPSVTEWQVVVNANKKRRVRRSAQVQP